MYICNKKRLEKINVFKPKKEYRMSRKLQMMTYKPEDAHYSGDIDNVVNEIDNANKLQTIAVAAAVFDSEAERQQRKSRKKVDPPAPPAPPAPDEDLPE